MESFDNIKIPFDELIKKLNESCKEKSIEVYSTEKKSDSLFHFKFGDGGIVAIYNTKDGINLKYKFGKQQEIGKQLLEHIFEENGGALNHIRGTYAKYEGILKKFDSIEKFSAELGDFINSQLGARIELKALDMYKVFSWDIIRANEKITIHGFRTSLLLQGKNYFLWDEVCSWIELKLNAPVNEIIVRVTGDREIIGKITISQGKGVIEEAEKFLKDRLDQAYDVLFEHDQKFLQTAVCLILYGNELPDYSGIVMSAFKGFEGYFRKMIAEKIGSRFSEAIGKVYNPKESFVWLFDPDKFTGAHCLKPIYSDSKNLSCDRAFEGLYLMYKDDRNPYAHSSGIATRTCDFLDDAKDLVDKIIASIGSTYKIFSR